MPDSEHANRAILLTPSGVSAIAVVRLIGPLVVHFARDHLSRPLASARCIHADLSDGADVIDDVIAVADPLGRWIDLNLHGGEWVVRATLNLARRCGFEIVATHPASLLPPE